LFDLSATTICLVGGVNLDLDDAAALTFGSSDDITMKFDGTTSSFTIDGASDSAQKLKIGATSALDIWIYGNTATDYIRFYGATSEPYVKFTNYDIMMMDDNYILLGSDSLAGSPYDGSIKWTSATSTIQIQGNTLFDDNVTVDGNLTVSGTLSVTGTWDPGAVWDWATMKP